jgi:hypothetical protein
MTWLVSFDNPENGMSLQTTLDTLTATYGTYIPQYGWAFVVKIQIIMPLKGCLAQIYSALAQRSVLSWGGRNSQKTNFRIAPTGIRLLILTPSSLRFTL